MLAQVERLSALLLRVQKNRSRGRTAGPAATQSASANEPLDVEISEDDEVEASKPISSAPPPPPPPARREPERRATPLEMAVTGQLDRELQTGPMAAPAPQARAVQARPSTTPITAPIATPAAPEPISPQIIEPDPPREATRPIAQVVSKHAPQVDATFGAMLKRSLSLRPH